ncbi:MAG TPA: hypothetical protein VET89_03750 [Stellaceae bacterium]|nr:hypothetical protein [Stellaceae bacterium]
MIVNLARRAGDELVLERIEDGVMFEGGQAQPGVIVSFTHQGHEISARIVDVSVPQGGVSGAEPIVTLEQIDPRVQDRESERALEKLPPRHDLFDTGDGRVPELPPRNPD